LRELRHCHFMLTKL